MTDLDTPEQNKLTEFEVVYCPICGFNITALFNSNRAAVFNIEQRAYLAHKQKAIACAPQEPPAKVLAAIKKYESGLGVEHFKIRCKSVACEKKLEYVMYNTFTGDTRMKDGRPILIVQPNPKKTGT